MLRGSLWGNFEHEFRLSKYQYLVMIGMPLMIYISIMHDRVALHEIPIQNKLIGDFNKFTSHDKSALQLRKEILTISTKNLHHVKLCFVCVLTQHLFVEFFSGLTYCRVSSEKSNSNYYVPYWKTKQRWYAALLGCLLFLFKITKFRKSV